MQPMTLRYALQLFALLLLSNAAVNTATRVHWHTCYFDEIHKDDRNDLPITQISAATTTKSGSTASAGRGSRGKQYLRIKFSAADLEDEKKYCKTEGSKVKDVFGTETPCNHDDVLDSEKKKSLLQIVRSAVVMHTERLRVRPLKGPIKVPRLTGPLCKLITVPSEHSSTGVADADMVLYVASFPSSKEDMFAAGAPCARIYDGRPVVGALTYAAAHIEASVYSARVAAHEIAHALGFTYKIMKSKIGWKIQKAYMRYKANEVEQVHTPTVSKFPKKQYDCGNPNLIELEDEKGVLSVPSHSHWKRRNTLEELMVGIVTTGFYTYLTLALFHDLGFYEANFNKAEEMDYGKSTGCNFFNHRCVEKGYVDNSRYLCSSLHATNLFCAPGRRAMGKCSIITKVEGLAYEYRYFYHKSGLIYYDYYAGEEKLLTDRCPVYEEQGDLSCTDGDNLAPGIKGQDSWCLRKRSNDNSNYIDGAMCAKVTVDENGDVYVQTSDHGESVRCKKNGGPFYTAKTVFSDNEIHTFECPTKAEVDQYNAMEKLFNDSTQTKSFEITATKQK